MLQSNGNKKFSGKGKYVDKYRKLYYCNFGHIYPLLVLAQNLKDKSIKSNYKSMLMDPKYIKYNS